MVKRQQVGALFNYRCAYCGKQLTTNNFTIDHIIPKACGGTDDIKNLLPCCKQCNAEKGSMSLEDFRELWRNKINVFLVRKNKENLALEDILFYYETQDSKVYFSEDKINHLLALSGCFEGSNCKNYSRAPKKTLLLTGDSKQVIQFVMEIKEWQSNIDKQIADIVDICKTGDNDEICSADGYIKTLQKIKNQNTTFAAQIVTMQKKFERLASRISSLEQRAAKK